MMSDPSTSVRFGNCKGMSIRSYDVFYTLTGPKPLSALESDFQEKVQNLWRLLKAW